jgi:hypothetical protein
MEAAKASRREDDLKENEPITGSEGHRVTKE